MSPRLLLVAVQLLTRLPVGDPMESPEDLGRSVRWFGVVGALVGGIAAFVWWAAALSLPRGTAATLAVLATVLITGALHEDGLADTADGLFGGATPARRLEIMGDSATGAFGVVAVVVAVLLKVTLVAALSPVAGAAALVVTGSLGRGLAAAGMLGMAPARTTGSGAALLGGLGVASPVVAGLSAIAATAVFAGIDTVAVVLGGLAAVAVVRLSATRRLGGLTGDVMGAMVVVTEVVCLAVLVGLEVGAGL